MSSSDRAVAPLLRRMAVLAAVLAGLAAAAGCTVRPLYGDATSAIGAQGLASSRLAMVEVKAEDNRAGQEVRNHLIFLFGGGKGQPANPAYHLELKTTASHSRAATIETRRVALEPTSGIVTVRSTYRLTDARSGAIISSGLRSVQAPYDIPIQEFAALRARRDAENRASRELAELLRLVVAQELEKPTSTSVPDVVLNPEQVRERDRPGEPASL